jgi:hypothetical protein
MLGIDFQETLRPEFALIMAGAAPLPGAAPYAQCYGGHQFGNWAGQLGDGRAITLGEILVPPLSPSPSADGQGEVDKHPTREERMGEQL